MLAVLLAFVLGQIVGPLHIEEEEDGPQIIFASTRDQVFYCDFSSPVCSDGRVITTTRSTPVPCEVSPGVWEMVPEDTGCYSVRGLESWASNTSYLSYGAELDREPWARLRSGTIEKLSDGYRITSAAGQSQPSGRIQVLSPQETEGSVTLSCVVRTQSPLDRLTLEAGTGVVRHIQALDTGGKWETVSVSGTVAAGATRWVGIAPRNTDLTPASVDVKACWLAHSSIPGRPCWGGEAPVTCDGERNFISTDGWPTERGEISVTFRAGPPTSGDNAIIESRDGGTILFSLRRRASDGMIRLITSGPTLDGASVEVGDTAHVRVVRDGSTVSLWVNGVKSAESGGMPAWVWSSTATLGRNPAGPSLFLNGSISSLRVRSFE